MNWNLLIVKNIFKVAHTFNWNNFTSNSWLAQLVTSEMKKVDDYTHEVNDLTLALLRASTKTYLVRILLPVRCKLCLVYARKVAAEARDEATFCWTMKGVLFPRGRDSRKLGEERTAANAERKQTPEASGGSQSEIITRL